MVLQMWCRMFLPAYLIGLLSLPCGRPFCRCSLVSVLPKVLRFDIDYYDNSCVAIAQCLSNGRILVCVGVVNDLKGSYLNAWFKGLVFYFQRRKGNRTKNVQVWVDGVTRLGISSMVEYSYVMWCHRPGLNVLSSPMLWSSSICLRGRVVWNSAGEAAARDRSMRWFRT